MNKGTRQNEVKPGAQPPESPRRPQMGEAPHDQGQQTQRQPQGPQAPRGAPQTYQKSNRPQQG